MNNGSLEEYAQFFNKHYDFLAEVDDRQGVQYTGDASDRYWQELIEKQSKELDVKNKNIAQLFSLSRKQIKNGHLKDLNKIQKKAIVSIDPKIMDLQAQTNIGLD